MNFKIKISLFAVLTIFMLCACSNEDRQGTEITGFPADGVIRVTTLVDTLETRAGWDDISFMTENRQFGLFVTPEAGGSESKFAYANARMVYKSGQWNEYAVNDPDAQTPLQRMLWENENSKVQVVAYVPYDATLSSLSTITKRIADQQNENIQGESVTACDYLYFKGMVNPTAASDKQDSDGNIAEYALKNGKIAIPFRHVVSKLNLSLDIHIDAIFNPNLSTATNLVTDLKVNGTTLGFNFDLGIGVMSKTTAQAEAITPWENVAAYVPGNETTSALASYECILVPQTVEEKIFSVSFNLDGKPYQWVSDKAITFQSGKKHKLVLSVDHKAVTLLAFTVDDWGQNEIDTTLPDRTGEITFDESHCSVGENIEFTPQDAHLQFPSEGGSAIIAFAGDFDKVLVPVTSDSRCVITSVEEGVYKNKKIKINVSPQETGGESYSVRLKVRNARLTLPDGLDILIDVRKGEDIPSVMMGGLEWMIYNGIGVEPSLYPTLQKGQTVRDVYRKDWAKYTGIRAWGPCEPTFPLLYPWEAKNYNWGLPANTQEDWTPGESSGIPCPKGWRLPTQAEFKKIWPHDGFNITKDKTYINNGVRYYASVEESGAPDIPYDASYDTNPPIKTNIFVISDGENELLFPMAGYRSRYESISDKNAPAVAAGRLLGIWCQDHPESSSGANAYTVSVSFEYDKYYMSKISQNQLAQSSYSIRCIKQN